MSGRGAADLRRLIARPGCVLAPGVVDPLSARLVKEAGFEIVYMGGNATTAVRLGMADVGLLTLTEVADHARRINEAAGLPLLIDADNGYGNALNVRRAVREFERAGVAGLHIEDQASPKRCGHFAGKQLIGTAEMVGKIKAALDARRDPDMVIIARTDATAVDGFDAALDRASAYIEAGADMLLMAPPLDLAQLEAAGRLVAPLLCPLDSTGRTPVAPPDDLASLGVKIGVFPTALVMGIIPVVRRLLAALKRDGTIAGIVDELASFDEYNALLGLAEFEALERRAQGTEGD